MRQSGKLLATVLAHLKKRLTAEMTTKDLSDIAMVELKKLGGKPAFLGYQGFPDVICISLNDEVVHGIPSAKRVIKEGDIVSLDFGVNYQGMITDAAISLVVGEAQPAVKKLVRDTERSLLLGIQAIHGGVHVGDIGSAIEKELNKEHYGIVRDLVGHGVGHDLHEDPNIPNYGYPGMGIMLKTNMTIAIEPMATLGGHQVYVDEDGWTIKTQDGSWAAHFEHTVLILDAGAEILTTM
ncbi:MAG: methionine aminopeptidase type [Candidatus Saccharibacteria bacterium]|nr:methionine aminopeptidase type [Candidatus Saccharibacteria bacterium]